MVRIENDLTEIVTLELAFYKNSLDIFDLSTKLAAIGLGVSLVSQISVNHASLCILNSFLQIF